MARIRWLALAVAMTACAPDAVTVPTPVAEALPERALPTLPEMRLRDVLGGRVLGVRVISERRAPIRVMIREGSPIRPGMQPLFVVDGIPLSQGGLEAAGVNPTEIVDLQILKGPDAVRTYGPRARNGAVLIRTRRR